MFTSLTQIICGIARYGLYCFNIPFEQLHMGWLMSNPAFTKLTSITQRQLKDASLRAQAEANRWIGKTLIWKIEPTNLSGKGKNLKGRECIVVQASYNDDGGIIVLVKTKTKDGLSFVDDNDMIHRRYRDLDRCFIETKSKL